MAIKVQFQELRWCPRFPVSRASPGATGKPSSFRKLTPRSATPPPTTAASNIPIQVFTISLLYISPRLHRDPERESRCVSLPLPGNCSREISSLIFSPGTEIITSFRNRPPGDLNLARILARWHLKQRHKFLPGFQFNHQDAPAGNDRITCFRHDSAARWPSHALQLSARPGSRRKPYQALRAVSTRPSKISGSLTARSASTLRFKSTSARLSPWMNSL